MKKGDVVMIYQRPLTNSETTGKTIILEGDGFAKLKAAIDVSAEAMLAKAQQETNPQRKRMMLLYARRKAEIEAELAQLRETKC